MMLRRFVSSPLEARVDRASCSYDGHDDDVDDPERAGDDDEEREREPAADAPERVHVSRKR